jgi:hypothetical protein
MTTIEAAWATGRARRAQRTRTRPPLLMLALSWLAARLPSWKRARTAVMQWTAFAAIDAGLFGWSWIAGAIGIGVSLLVLEALGSER